MAGRGSELTIETLNNAVIYDVDRMMKTLGKIDPALRRATVAKMKLAAKPMVAEAKSLVPEDSGLNWYNWRTEQKEVGKPGTGRVVGPYDAKKIRKGIKVTYKGPSKRDRQKEIFPLLKLQNTDAGGAIFDIAGKANGSGRNSEGKARGRAMIDKLRKQQRASRIVWRAAEKHLPTVQRGVADAIKDMEEAIQARVDKAGR